MERIKTDIAIIGGGAAGLRAALAAAEKNPDLKIAIVSKVYPVRSHTVSAEGGIAGVLDGGKNGDGKGDDSHKSGSSHKNGDSLEAHAFDTVKGSDFLADQDAVEFFVKEAPLEIVRLEQWGCPWSREEDGSVATRAFGGMSAKRTVYAADKTGFYMLHSLFERTLRHENIVRFDEFFVTSLFVAGGRIAGCYAIDLKTGRHIVVEAKAVILATGGAGKVFQFTTNGFIKTGDGMHLALKIGAPLKDMEFIQFHPTGLVRTGILITEAARGEGGYLLNNKGERFMKNYLPQKMELGPRDMVARAMISEMREGRGFENAHGNYIELDIRHLGEKKIDEKLPLVREIAREYGNVDPVSQPIPVRPVMHYIMGGVDTDIHGRTEIPGLYAAGEVACVSINGANRLGSNSLAECLVFGKVAGEEASGYALHTEAISIPDSEVRDEENRLASLLRREGGEKVAAVREELEEAMEGAAGIIREKGGMENGLSKIKELRERYDRIRLSDRSSIFNTEFTGVLELDSMLHVAECILFAALAREESRGSHFRSDFLKRDDERFLKHSIIRRKGDKIELEYKPVTITQWKPQERTY